MVLPRADDPHFCHTSAAIFTFSIRRFSECCCGPQETHKNVLRHPCSDPWVAHSCDTSLLIFTFSNCVISLRPLLSSNSFKHTIKTSLFGVPCFVLERHHRWFLNKDSTHTHSWSEPSLLGSTVLRIFIVPAKIQKVWSVHEFDDIVSFS